MVEIRKREAKEYNMDLITCIVAELATEIDIRGVQD